METNLPRPYCPVGAAWMLDTCHPLLLLARFAVATCCAAVTELIVGNAVLISAVLAQSGSPETVE